MVIEAVGGLCRRCGKEVLGTLGIVRQLDWLLLLAAELQLAPPRPQLDLFAASSSRWLVIQAERALEGHIERPQTLLAVPIDLLPAVDGSAGMAGAVV
jgi:hypothetical protein